ncbi:AAA family ATPase [Clostridium aminobutyricum]|uniref:AAA family ATPase n=1 Tax=Clostridium aminobutyricum TaxID=33953 RepID=A0A939D9P9_CLOAM|nr:AAA family ATPase [Clostridium aminobutyricum]MBN7773298.1 AAA family ATPase [Clostridium aminobutyricum]
MRQEVRINLERKFIDSIFLNKNIEEHSYLYHLPIVQYLMKDNVIRFENDVTFFVGENGTGKSTLLEAIAVAYGFNPEGGTKNFTFSTNDTHSELCDYLTVSRSKYAKDGFFLRAESFYNVATNIEELDKEVPLLQSYGGISLHKQSHGESFLALVQNRFGGNGLYILDEPEAALSPSRLLTLIAEIDNLVKNNSQFIIATHSPILIAFPNAKIYQLTETGMEAVSYRQTEHYQLTRSFLENPEKMLRYLLED